MGFGTIVANIIMFISVLLLATAMIGVFKNSVESTSDSFNTKTDYLNKKISTAMEINSVVYDNNSKQIIASVVNTGSTILNLKKVDVYVDGFFIPRNESNRTLSIEPSTEIKDKGYWNPSEVLKVVIYKELDNSTHTFSITSPYGNKAESIISQS